MSNKRHRRKLKVARELCKQENMRLRQRLLPWVEAETATYPKRRCVSLGCNKSKEATGPAWHCQMIQGRVKRRVFHNSA